MDGFNGRTVQPLGAAAPPGYRNSTSRSQTSSSIWALERYYAVIPMVTFIRYSLAIPLFTNGSYNPPETKGESPRPRPPPRSSIGGGAVGMPSSVSSDVPLAVRLVVVYSNLTLCTPSLLFRRRSPQPNCLT